jgi:RNA polymerase sigma-70 factor (ECF subfamily)
MVTPMLMTTDTVLVQRAALGDREAFASIYEESFRCVYSYAARQTGTRAAAEALTEVILIQVFATLGSYEGDVPFAAWLQSIAKNVVTGTASRRRLARVVPKSPFAHSAPR